MQVGFLCVNLLKDIILWELCTLFVYMIIFRLFCIMYPSEHQISVLFLWRYGLFDGFDIDMCLIPGEYPEYGCGFGISFGFRFILIGIEQINGFAFVREVHIGAIEVEFVIAENSYFDTLVMLSCYYCFEDTVFSDNLFRSYKNHLTQQFAQNYKYQGEWYGIDCAKNYCNHNGGR